MLKLFSPNLEGCDGGSSHHNGFHLVLVGVPLVVHAGDHGGGVEASGGGAAGSHLTRAPGGVGVALLLLVPGPLQRTSHIFRVALLLLVPGPLQKTSHIVGVTLLLRVPGPLQKTSHIFRVAPGSRAPTENITYI